MAFVTVTAIIQDKLKSATWVNREIVTSIYAPAKNKWTRCNDNTPWCNMMDELSWGICIFYNKWKETQNVPSGDVKLSLPVLCITVRSCKKPEAIAQRVEYSVNMIRGHFCP
jgi:hypothetical protein